MPFKDTKEGQTNYCIRCEQEAGNRISGGLERKHTCGRSNEAEICSTCKTNTLDKCNCNMGKAHHKDCEFKPEGVGEWDLQSIKECDKIQVCNKNNVQGVNKLSLLRNFGEIKQKLTDTIMIVETVIGQLIEQDTTKTTLKTKRRKT